MLQGLIIDFISIKKRFLYKSYYRFKTFYKSSKQKKEFVFGGVLSVYYY
jgi:hypothetical protein